MASVCPVVLRVYGPFVLVVVPPEGNGNLIDEKIGVFVVKGYKKSCAFEIKTCTQVFADKSFFKQLFGLHCI